MNHDNADATEQNSSDDPNGISSVDRIRRRSGQRIPGTTDEREIAVVLLPLRKDEWRQAVHENVRAAAI